MNYIKGGDISLVTQCTRTRRTPPLGQGILELTTGTQSVESEQVSTGTTETQPTKSEKAPTKPTETQRNM